MNSDKNNCLKQNIFNPFVNKPKTRYFYHSVPCLQSPPNLLSSRSYHVSSVSRCSRCLSFVACGDVRNWPENVTDDATTICRTMPSAWSDLVLFIGSVSPNRIQSHKIKR